jgi:hypothetical protein
MEGTVYPVYPKVHTGDTEQHVYGVPLGTEK